MSITTLLEATFAPLNLPVPDLIFQGPVALVPLSGGAVSTLSLPLYLPPKVQVRLNFGRTAQHSACLPLPNVPLSVAAVFGNVVGSPLPTILTLIVLAEAACGARRAPASKPAVASSINLLRTIYLLLL